MTWFDEGPAGVAATERLRVVRSVSAQEDSRLTEPDHHQAALAEIDLPPHPLGDAPTRWEQLRVQLGNVVVLGAGVFLGFSGVWLVLNLIFWLLR
jgi:hypothetical protein